jgi:geranylgeranyl reductase
MELYDTVVVGGGPAGATAAHGLAKAGRSVALLDRAGRIKPCGGAIPPRLIRDFAIPDHLLKAKITAARIVAPSAREVDMPIDGGYVGMVDRDDFDEWLRQRAHGSGATRLTGTLQAIERQADRSLTVSYQAKDDPTKTGLRTIRARTLIGADGANSVVARIAMPKSEQVPFVFAYHEIIEAPQSSTADYDAHCCGVHYTGELSPDFYAWVFPHGRTASIGVGSAQKGFQLRPAVDRLRQKTGLSECPTLRREGAPIPLWPRRRWDDGDAVLLAGDAAGVVAPASGEGIYYAMLGGSLAADAAIERLRTGDPRALATARKRFMSDHGRVFWVLGMLQHFFYRNDKRRERFVSMCRDKDVQRLTWDAYMNKRLVRADPAAHLRILMKDIAHLTGLMPAR